MKKIIGILSALAILSCILVSCSEKSNNSHESSELTVSSNDLSEAENTSDDTSVADTSQDETDTLENKIKNYFVSFFNNNDEFTLKTKDVFDISSEGAMVTGFYYNDKLELLSLSVYNSGGSTDRDYYMIDNETIFLVEKNYVYNGPITDETFKVDKETVQLYMLFDENVYEFDFSEMKLGNKIEDNSRKDMFNEAIAVLDTI